MAWSGERVIQCAVAALGIALLSACGGRAAAGDASSGSPTVRVATAAAAATTETGGGGCDNCFMGSPIPGCDSPTQQLTFADPPTNKLPHTVLGNGPVYWGGQPVWHTGGEEGVVVVDRAVTVPVSVTFTGPSPGDSATLGGLKTSGVYPVPGEWAYDEGVFTPSAPGCWTMHAVYGGHVATVSFTVVSGAAPPG